MSQQVGGCRLSDFDPLEGIGDHMFPLSSLTEHSFLLHETSRHFTHFNPQSAMWVDWTGCESVFLYNRFTVTKYWPGHQKHLSPSPIAVLPPSAHLGKIAEGKRVTAADRKQEDEDRVDGGGTRDGGAGGANKQVVRVLAEIEGASQIDKGALHCSLDF